MPKIQRNPIGADLKPEVVQRNLNELFEYSHTHEIRETAPDINEGSVNDVIPVKISGSYYLYIKFPVVGWKRVLLS